MTESNVVFDHHKLVAEGYDICAEAYQTLFSLHPSTTRSRWTDALADSLAPGAAVLELGCGNGIMSLPFIARGCVLTGADISAKQVELARKTLPDATILHADMMGLEFPPESFDAICAFYAIPHLPVDEQGVMIQRIATWLKPGGVFVVNFPEEAYGGFIDFLNTKTHWISMGVEGTRQLFNEHGYSGGLRVVEEEIKQDEVQEGAVEKVSGKEMFHWIKAVKCVPVPA